MDYKTAAKNVFSSCFIEWHDDTMVKHWTFIRYMKALGSLIATHYLCHQAV